MYNGFLCHFCPNTDQSGLGKTLYVDLMLHQSNVCNTVDPVIFACLNVCEFLILGLLTKFKICEFSFLLSGAIFNFHEILEFANLSFSRNLRKPREYYQIYSIGRTLNQHLAQTAIAQ